ncbi:MAG: T9SS type A sorting domain-containing protein [Bacteroidota bacterium]
MKYFILSLALSFIAQLLPAQHAIFTPDEVMHLQAWSSGDSEMLKRAQKPSEHEFQVAYDYAPDHGLRLTSWRGQHLKEARMIDLQFANPLSKSAKHLPAGNAIVIPNLYEGIAVNFYQITKDPLMDIIVNNPVDLIQFALRAPEGTTADLEEGRLVLQTADHDYILEVVAFQSASGKRLVHSVQPVLIGDGFGFQLNGAIDPQKPVCVHVRFKAASDTPLPETQAEVIAYPNPARDVATVEARLPSAGGQAHIALYDLTGQQVRLLFDGAAADVQGRRFKVVAGDLPAGMYVVRVKAGDFRMNQKLVFEK